MSVFTGILAGLGAAGTNIADANTKLWNEQALNQQRAEIEQAAMQSRADLEEQKQRNIIDYVESKKNAPMLRFQKLVEEELQKNPPTVVDTTQGPASAASQVPIAQPVQNGPAITTGSSTAGSWNDINTAYQAQQPARNAEQLAVLQSELAAEKNPENIAALKREIARVGQVAPPVEPSASIAQQDQAPIAAQPKARTTQAAIEAAAQRAYATDPLAYQAYKALSGDRYMAVGDGGTVFDQTKGVPVFTNTAKDEREAKKLESRERIAAENQRAKEDREYTRELEKRRYEESKGQYIQTDQGLVFAKKSPDGTPIATPVSGPDGKILTKDKPLTENQGNAVSYGIRALQAEKDLQDLNKNGFDALNLKDRIASNTPFDMGRGMMSDQAQQYENLQRNFVSAVLRKESGAAISNSEFDNERKKYFPQVGDGPKVIEQKAKMRNLAIEGLKLQAGPNGAQMIMSTIQGTNPPVSPTTKQPAVSGIKFLGFE